MFLIFDTETTSLPNDKLPANHPDQARLLQLACILLDDKFQEVGSFCSLIKVPEGISVHPKAFEAHGISVEECRKVGVHIEYVLNVFNDFYWNSSIHICHNTAFDNQLINIEQLILYPKEPVYKFDNSFCTMKAMVDMCKLPFKNGRGRFGQAYKWPRLEEACAFANIPFNSDEAHDALYDVRKTGELFKWLFLNGHVLHDPNLKIQHEVIPT